jgi:hypothetical protein
MTDSIALLSSAPVTRLHDVFDGWEGGGAELGWALLTGTLFPCHCTRPERNSLGLYLREGLSGCTPVRFAMATLSGCTPLTGSLHGSLFPLRFPYGSFIFMPCHTQQTACNTVLSYLLEINDELLIEILQVRHKRILGTAQTNAQACHKRIVGRFKNVTDESLSTAQTNTGHSTNECLCTAQTDASNPCLQALLPAVLPPSSRFDSLALLLANPHLNMLRFPPCCL